MHDNHNVKDSSPATEAMAAAFGKTGNGELGNCPKSRCKFANFAPIIIDAKMI
jgi:hypothetical protein